MWCKSLTLEKYISYGMKWFFSPPFFVCVSLFAFKLTRRQTYTYTVGLYTRPEIKSWPDVKFCAHARCVLPRCFFLRLYFLEIPSLYTQMIVKVQGSLTLLQIKICFRRISITFINGVHAILWILMYRNVKLCELRRRNSLSPNFGF